MGCERWRDLLSAQLDGEDDPADRQRVDEHLAGCAGCREWLDRAATVNRLTRTGVPTAPDLTASILAALPQPDQKSRPAQKSRPGQKGRPDRESGPDRKSGPARKNGPDRKRRRLPVAAALYLALAVVGAVQLILGLGQVGGGALGSHAHTSLGATPGHLFHESAAWNVAVGAGYLFIALRRNRPSGLVPMLTAFVGMLLLLSFNDLTGGRVDANRLVSHGFVLLGYLLVVTLSRIPGGFAAPPGARATGWRLRFDDDKGEERESATPPRLRLVPPGPLTARHEDRRAA